MNVLYQYVHKLWLFSLIAQHGSFRAAASHAGLTQSALSQHLASLETALGHQLIIRKQSPLRLTEAGTRLSIEIVPILQSLDALAPGAPTSRTKARNIRLGAYESVALTYLREPLQQLACGEGDVRVHLRLDRAAVLHGLVQEGELDVAVVDTPATAPLESEPFGRSRLGLYTDTSCADLGWRTTGVIRIGTLTFGRGARPAYFERFLDFHQNHFAARKIDLKTVVETDSFEALRAMAVAGGIVAVLPEHVAERRKGDLVELEVEDRPDDCAGNHVLYLVNRRGNAPLRNALIAQTRAAEPGHRVARRPVAADS